MWTYLCGHTGTAREETDRAREVRIETLSSNDEREQQPNYIRGLDPDHPGFAVTACRCRSSASTGLHRLPGQACVDRWVGTRQISLSHIPTSATISGRHCICTVWPLPSTLLGRSLAAALTQWWEGDRPFPAPSQHSTCSWRPHAVMHRRDSASPPGPLPAPSDCCHSGN